MAISKLNDKGQLVSEALSPLAPISVASNVVVSGLNADLLDDVQESSMLRTDEDRTLIQDKTLTVNGKVKVNTGSLEIGDYKLNQTNGVFHIDYIGT